MYPAADSIRRDLAQAFTSDARAVGVDVLLEGLGWEAIEPRMGVDALVLGGGSPFDPDVVAYPLLHSSYGGDGFNAPAFYVNPEVDTGLEAARRAVDPAERVGAVRAWQRAYAAAPGFVFLTFLGHSYVVFSWPGIAEAVVTAALAVDFPMLAALSVLATAVVLLGSLAADLAVALADPRVVADG